MIEIKLVVGRYLEFKVPREIVTDEDAPKGFKKLAPQVLHIAESQSLAAPVSRTNWPEGYKPSASETAKVAVNELASAVRGQFHRQRTSAVTAGSIAIPGKAHRNFIWLNYIPGVVSHVKADGYDVLTGPMSGCWIMTYTWKKKRYVAHIGTENLRDSENSKKAKKAWNDFVDSGEAKDISGFNPVEKWIGKEPKYVVGTERQELPMALLTSDGRFYTVYAFTQEAQATRWRVAGIQEMEGLEEVRYSDVKSKKKAV